MLLSFASKMDPEDDAAARVRGAVRVASSISIVVQAPKDVLVCPLKSPDLFKLQL